MKEIKKVGVVGAGQMGSGIAQVCATSGYDTFLFDLQESSIEKGFATIKKSLDKFVAKGNFSEDVRGGIDARLHKASALNQLADCDLVIEAIIENPDIKFKLFQEVDALVDEDTIIASNTSSISITHLASAIKKPENFIGIHFMNPVPIMKLIELIRGLQTSDETYNTISAFCDSLQKTTTLAPDGPGFIVNRILCPMINEAIFLLQEGCKPEDIDASMKLGTNQPMGPLELADFVGLDTLLFILEILHDELGEDKYRPCPLLRKYVEAGWVGRKAGRGFYTHK